MKILVTGATGTVGSRLVPQPAPSPTGSVIGFVPTAMTTLRGTGPDRTTQNRQTGGGL